MLKMFKNSAHNQRGSTQPFSISLSVAFYNNLRCFDLMMAALEVQSLQNFELVISDDGSRPDVVAAVQTRLEQSSIPSLHLWQEDKGFRKNRMLNWFIHYSNSDYLAFVDQDCIPHPLFLEEHLSAKSDSTVISGRRVEFPKWFSETLTAEKIRQGFIQNNYWWILFAISYMKDNNGPKGIHFADGPFRRFLNRKPRPLVGCNFSVFKKDLVAINGFDTRYEAAGTGEDSDIDFRLQLNGVRIRPAVHGPIQYHIWHKLTPPTKNNEAIFSKVQADRQMITLTGLKEQLAAAQLI